MLVGMGTFFAGVFRAPMTSIFMVFEVSASYVIILPVMIANTISYLISRKLQPQAFFALVAAEDGLELPSTEQQREEPALRVEDAMSPAGIVLDKNTPVRTAGAIVREHGSVLVESEDGLWSMMTEADLAGAPREAPLEAAIALDPLPRVYPTSRSTPRCACSVRTAFCGFPAARGRSRSSACFRSTTSNGPTASCGKKVSAGRLRRRLNPPPGRQCNESTLRYPTPPEL